MLGFVIRRIVSLFFVLLIAVSLTFILLRSAPGSPFALNEKQSDPATIAKQEYRYNLDGSKLSQCLRYLGILAKNPDPDLLIRTSGEMRTSNFLPWQLAYTELYFSDKFWPDFDEAELQRAVAEFSRRQRRFGLTADQLRDKGDNVY